MLLMLKAGPSAPGVVVDLLTGLQAAWRLNETDDPTPSNRVDSSGNGHTLSPTGTTSGEAGLLCNALQVEFGAHCSKSGWVVTGQPFSFAGWIKPTNGADEGCILSQLDDGEPIHKLTISGGAAGFQVNGLNSISGGTITGGAWNHLVGVQSGTTSTLFLNGAQVATGTKTVTAPNVNRTVRVGHPGGIWIAPMDPTLIDMVLVYNVALSAPQIAALYNNGLGRDPT